MQRANVSATESIKSNVPVTKNLMHNGSAAIRYFSFSTFKKETFFTEENTLVFIKEGALRIGYGKTKHEVNKNEMLFIKKDILIQYETGVQSGETANVEYVMFFLKYEIIKEFTRLIKLNIQPKTELPPIVVDGSDKQLMKYIDSLEQYFCTPETMETNLVKIKLLELLFYLSNSNRIILGQLLDCRAHFRSNITTTVEENVTNSLSLYQLAMLSGRSLSSFRRDFLAIYNVPPSQWIRLKRLEKAKELLTGSTMSVTDICYTTGFENIAHFSRLFKSQFGISPSEYRFARSIA